MTNHLSTLLLMSIISLYGCGPTSKSVEDRVVDASCGMCRFGKTDQKGCLINIRLDGKVQPVVGAPVISMEEMHAPGGYCVTIRQAKVSGKVDGDRFMASSWELLPLREASPKLPAGH